mmetsp:Transcript_14634/g.7154  ORF Transcript_14634/g.7154 Transcript_14634/m.7154 type:complete len:105 (-) Transcript_14634:1880-2194(-)
MFGIGMPEMILILAIALIVIGPKKLPDLAKSLGRTIGEFKKSVRDFKDSVDIESEIKDDLKDTKEVFDEFNKDLKNVTDIKTNTKDMTIETFVSSPNSNGYYRR